MLVGLRAVWYCFLVVSGKSSTVLAVLYCFLAWYTNLATRKQKRNESLQSSSSFIARARARFKIARAIRCSVVDIKTERIRCPAVDIKTDSRYVSIEAYPFALPCGERIEGEYIDACSRASGFVLRLVLPMEGPPKLSLRWARCLTTGSVYFVFRL